MQMLKILSDGKMYGERYPPPMVQFAAAQALQMV